MQKLTLESNRLGPDYSCELSPARDVFPYLPPLHLVLRRVIYRRYSTLKYDYTMMRFSPLPAMSCEQSLDGRLDVDNRARSYKPGLWCILALSRLGGQ